VCVCVCTMTKSDCAGCLQRDDSVCIQADDSVCVRIQGDHGCHVGAGQVLQGLPGQLLLHLCADPAPLHLRAARLP